MPEGQPANLALARIVRDLERLKAEATRCPNGRAAGLSDEMALIEARARLLIE